LRHINTKYKADIVRKEHSTAKKLLDFGCGTGTFLEHIRNHYACCGVELNEEARKITEIKGFPVYASIKEINASTRFDLITLWHVLEHIQPIHETIDLLRKHLAKDGIMIIAIPNVLSWDCQHFQEKWAAYDVPRHLYHFSSESLKKLLRSHRIRIRNQYPLKMDSFYISLQSLKFQGKGFSPIRAVLYGLQSNRKGGITGDFSSNIYICEKY
jgi:2-polyprenyl-3-methyl-5-hydroxy-6-metoxy-1,4-benzoquinol methylase